jgi:hypothetical protein
MPSDAEIPTRDVTLTLCELCISGAGGECHVPGCALYLNRAPDIPLSAAEKEREGDAGMRHAALSAAEKERVESAIRDVLIDWVGRPWRALLAARCADAALKVITSDPPERIEGE